MVVGSTFSSATGVDDRVRERFSSSALGGCEMSIPSRSS